MVHRTLTLLIALVWLANGLFAKVLAITPRHEAIVAHILGAVYARPLTVAIGLAEIITAVWIMTGRHRRSTAVFQIAIVLTMNLLETYLARDLLLWGGWNLAFALLFCGVLYYHGFVSSPQTLRDD